MNVADVRTEFRRLLSVGEYTDGRGGRTVEIVGASFTADEPSVFGELNTSFVERELAWYASQSLNIADFVDAPTLWKRCAAPDGSVNSNYGWCVYSEANGCQFDWVLGALREDAGTRRAQAIYTRPSMHFDAVVGGRNDFMCTNAVLYLLRRGRLDAVVQMRSSDAVFGYRNDLVWQRRVLEHLASELGTEPGRITWQAGSLHVYERHWPLIVG
jgi:thymidylate synthase